MLLGRLYLRRQAVVLRSQDVMGSLGVGFRVKLCPERRFRIVETLPKTILIFMNKNNPGDIDISPSSSGLQRYQRSCLEDEKLFKNIRNELQTPKPADRSVSRHQ